MVGRMMTAPWTAKVYDDGLATGPREWAQVSHVQKIGARQGRYQGYGACLRRRRLPLYGGGLFNGSLVSTRGHVCWDEVVCHQGVGLVTEADLPGPGAAPRSGHRCGLLSPWWVLGNCPYGGGMAHLLCINKPRHAMRQRAMGAPDRPAGEAAAADAVGCRRAKPDAGERTCKGASLFVRSRLRPPWFASKPT